MIPRPDIEMTMLGLSKIYKEELTEPLVDIWVNVLEELTREEIKRAVKEYLRDPKNVFFPKPGQIYGLARPDATEGDAQLISERIWTALTRYGTDSVGEERAKNFINSDVGWAVIQNQGGWSGFHKSNNLTMDAAPTLKAQWRKSALELSQKKKRGEPLVSLPDSKSNLRQLNLVMKTLE